MDLIDEIRAAVAGLTYPSETDAPFEVIASAVAPTAIQAVEPNVSERPIEAVEVDSWFKELADDDQADRFAALRKMLEARLTGLSVFRVGLGSEIGVYVIGRAADGRWIGLKTLSVET